MIKVQFLTKKNIWNIVQFCILDIFSVFGYIFVNSIQILTHKCTKFFLSHLSKLVFFLTKYGLLEQYVYKVLVLLGPFFYLIILDYKTGGACGAVHACILHVVQDLFNIVRLAKPDPIPYRLHV